MHVCLPLGNWHSIVSNDFAPSDRPLENDTRKKRIVQSHIFSHGSRSTYYGAIFLWVGCSSRQHTRAAGDARGSIWSLAKHHTARQIALVPPAPGHDMTAAELTHGLQQVMSQSSMDQAWFNVLHEEISTHAEYINGTSIKMVGALSDIQAIREDAERAERSIHQADC